MENKTIMYKRQKLPENVFSWTKVTDCEIVIKQGNNKVTLTEKEFHQLANLLGVALKTI